MATPTGQKPLPRQTPNSSAPICMIEGEPSGLMDSTGKPITGNVQLFGYVTAAWRYLFGTFAQTSTSINPSFTQTAGVSYSQSQQQALIDQVALLSKQLGRTT